MNFFDIKKRDDGSGARLGIINTARGRVQTPAFLPIGTKGSVRAVTAQELKFWGAEMVLANTYHLWMRPGDGLIRRHGGIHKFMGWDGPVFTDSGGFQVFSLGEKRGQAPRESHGRVIDISETGVKFRSDIDGQLHVLTPEKSIEIQSGLGSDIALVLDYFPGFPFTRERTEKAVDLTLRWAERSLRQFGRIREDGVNPDQKLFGIVQGGNYADLRKKCAAAIDRMGFSGHCIGGVAVGEPPEVMYEAVRQTVPHLAADRPRHLLGVGAPEQIVRAVAEGCDTFDCVLPTRNARHGMLYVSLKRGEGEGYTAIQIGNRQYAEDFTPVDSACGCYLCTHHTRAYLRHLFAAGELLAVRLATMHNLRFFLDLMAKTRRAIEYGSFTDWLSGYRGRG